MNYIKNKTEKKEKNMKKLVLGLLMMLAACTSEPASDFKSGSYKLKDSLNNVPTTITFSADGKVNGKVVNYMMGNYTLGKDNAITIGPLATTMMMGPEEAMDAEQNFLQILPKVKSYKMQGNYLVLVTDNGGELLLEPYTPSEDEE